jgi:hypothetical protein
MKFRILIVEGDLHEWLARAIDDMAEHVLVGDLFQHFWDRIQDTHSSERQKMMSLADQAIKNLPDDQVGTFLRQAVEWMNELPLFGECHFASPQ